MVINLIQLGYANNYDKNPYLESFSKANVYMYMDELLSSFCS